jgi:hypothetical protein
MTMKLIFKLATLGAALGLTLGFGSAVMARATDAASAAATTEVEIVPELERIESFTLLTRPYSWTPVDEDTVIVWATAFRPYLVELAFPSRDLKFTDAIGVTSVGSRVYAKFDSVQVRGLRYPIESIYKLTREEAKNWNRT